MPVWCPPALRSTCSLLLGAGQKAPLTFGHVTLALAPSGPAALLLSGHGWSHQEQRGAGRFQPEPAFLETEALGVAHWLLVHCPGCLYEECGLGAQLVPQIEMSGCRGLTPPVLRIQSS